jgi:hypothetical protein
VSLPVTKKSKHQIACQLDDQLLSSGLVKPPSFTSLKDIECVKESFFFNVMVVIEQIERIQMFHRKNKDPLELLNVIVNDQSDCLTRLSFWGKQALSFNHKKGDILMLFDVDVFIDRPISLRVNRKSRYILVEKYFNIENAENVRSWWENKNLNKKK